MLEYGRSIRVFNTHFDHICGPARTLGVRIILEYMHRMNERAPMPSILMGDLNASPDSKPIRILRENLHTYPDIHLNCAYDLEQNRVSVNTYHGFSGRITPHPPIDYIFVSDEFVVRDTYLDTTHTGGLYPSDHFSPSGGVGAQKAERGVGGIISGLKQTGKRPIGRFPVCFLYGAGHPPLRDPTMALKIQVSGFGGNSPTVLSPFPL